MKLIKAHVQNFRSVEDSQEFEIDNITCLVGKNEAGKTAILQALEGLRPYDSKAKYNKTRDYPRRYLNSYDERHEDEEAVIIKSTWTLDGSDKKAVEDIFGKGSITGDQLVAYKHYEEEVSWDLPFDEAKALAHLMSSHALDAAERACLQNSQTTEDACKKLEAVAEKTEKQKALMAAIGKYKDKSAYAHAADILAARMPKFLYFSHYDRMSGEIQIEKLKQDKTNKTLSSGDEVFLDFLEYAGTDLDEMISAQTFEELNSKCEAASNRITDQIFTYWTQNPYLEIEVKITKAEPKDQPPFNAGTVARARVKNTLHRVTVPFSERSAGFIWFFSFLVKFAQVKKEYGNVIILLDEPGLTLHGKAQADLLRYFKEQLEPDHQVIFSTHSPFMVNPDELMSVRTVEDVIEDKSSRRPNPLGTKVSADILTTDPDTIFPMQGALGYEITQSLFIGKNTLLVEGPSDILYLRAASSALQKQGRTGLDSRWVICPSGGIDKIMPFASLFGGNRLNIAILTDFAKGQKNKLESIKRSKILKEGHVYSVVDFCDKDEADIEDLFEGAVFADLVNQAYSLQKKHQLTAQKLDDADQNTCRNVIKAAAYFNTLPNDIPVFDHFQPASWLIQNMAFFNQDDVGIKKSLDRFEEIFKAMNMLVFDEKQDRAAA